MLLEKIHLKAYEVVLNHIMVFSDQIPSNTTVIKFTARLLTTTFEVKVTTRDKRKAIVV